MIRIFLVFILSGYVSFGFGYSKKDINRDLDILFTHVNINKVVNIQGKNYTVNMDKVLRMTAMIESNYGGDRARSKAVAKTFMQIEKKSADFYLKQVPKEKAYLEKRLGRKLIWDSNRDAIYVSYLIYMSKIKTHPKWLDKFANTKHFSHGNVNFYIYKLYYNSIKGKTTYITYLNRERQYNYFQK
ncbi:MAG: hypothetical protein ACRCZ0_08265 [Cetobacterium sp.]